MGPNEKIALDAVLEIIAFCLTHQREGEKFIGDLCKFLGIETDIGVTEGISFCEHRDAQGVRCGRRGPVAKVRMTKDGVTKEIFMCKCPVHGFER